ncbi:hypothetical protein EDD18DRAFT_1100987 [Armillaria luteobubalina]|uniref:Uncharacterized protein n=1 Tax=Armillaria luteobubalina TaxID=153913 RepID=A0AA39QJ29_9AGAR|nr:hypothetical protein EDD18DRAFT_1100987 [Armillaria luteobubalina]
MVLQRLSNLTTISCNAFELDWLALAGDPIVTLRLLQLHCCQLPDTVWTDVSTAFPSLSYLRIIDFVATVGSVDASVNTTTVLQSPCHMCWLIIESGTQATIDSFLHACSACLFFKSLADISLRVNGEVLNMFLQALLDVAPNLEVFSAVRLDYLKPVPHVFNVNKLQMLSSLSVESCMHLHKDLLHLIKVLKDMPALSYFRILYGVEENYRFLDFELHAKAWETIAVALPGITNLSHLNVLLYDKDPVLLYDLEITLDELHSTLTSITVIPDIKVALTHRNQFPYLPLTNLYCLELNKNPACVIGIMHNYYHRGVLMSPRKSDMLLAHIALSFIRWKFVTNFLVHYTANWRLYSGGVGELIYLFYYGKDAVYRVTGNPSNDQHSDGSVVTEDTIPLVEDVNLNDVDDEIASSPTPSAGRPVADKIIGPNLNRLNLLREDLRSLILLMILSLQQNIILSLKARYNPWAGIIDAIPKLRRIKTLDSNMEYGEDRIQVYDWISDFQNDFPFLLHLMTLAFIPSTPRLTNLALGNASDFKYNNKKIMGAYTYPQSFFMISSVTFSSLFKGEFNRTIAIKPLASFWPRQASVLAQIMGVDFERNLFSFKTVRDGLLFTTYPKPKDPSGPPLPSKARINSKTFGPGMCQFHVHSLTAYRLYYQLFGRGMTMSELNPTQIHKCPPIKSELKEGTIAFLVFTVTKYGEDVGSFNIQIIGKIYDLPAVRSSMIPAKPLPKYLTELGDIGVLGDEFPETPSDDDGDTQISQSTKAYLHELAQYKHL